jgi:hypothetical protein
MWLDMSGVRCCSLPCHGDMIPDPAEAAQLITARTKAIVLVTPNNPCGVEYPAEVIQAFYDLAKSRGLALIIDETYRDFHAQPGPPHHLFEQDDWQDTLIQLYSFSKAYRLTGHRVGAVTACQTRLAEIEKFLDTVTICPSQLGQKAALWGLQNLGTGWPRSGMRSWPAGRPSSITSPPWPRKGGVSWGLAPILPIWNTRLTLMQQILRKSSSRRPPSSPCLDLCSFQQEITTAEVTCVSHLQISAQK